MTKFIGGINLNDLKIEVLKIKDLKPYAKNAKKHPKKQVERIANSIESFGMCDPIGIWKDNTVIEGHGRLEALKQLGYDEVPCIRLDHLTDEERKAYTLVHNKVAESEWDNLILDEEINSLTEFDMSDFGFDVFSMDDIDELEGYNAEADDREHFSKTFTFPIEKKKQIICYLKKHQNEIVDMIIKESENDD